MSLTKVTFSMIDGTPVNVLDYGADPTGAEDSAAAIRNACSPTRICGIIAAQPYWFGKPGNRKVQNNV